MTKEQILKLLLDTYKNNKNKSVISKCSAFQAAIEIILETENLKEKED